MAKAKSSKSQSIKDAAKEAYLKSHTKEQMYAAYDALHDLSSAQNRKISGLEAELMYVNEAKTKNTVRCNKLALENASLTLALNDSKHRTKVYGSIMIGLLVGFSLIIIFY